MRCARLNRLFAADGKCFDLALDHGFFNECSFLTGIEDMGKAIGTGIRAGVDAIQVAPGQAHFLQRVAGREKPSLVLRVDTANIYGQRRPAHLFSQLIADPVGEALRLDAACVILNLFYLEEDGALQQQALANLAAVCGACRKWELPVMVEPLVLRPTADGAYESVGDVDRLVALVRQTVELGADVIKCDPTDDGSDFHRVVEAACGKPVLARGGGRVSEVEILQRTRELMDEGASGVVYGRNITQHPRPESMGRALVAIVHRNATVAQAESLLRS